MGDELVYLLQGGPHYKIGRTRNLAARVKTLQTSHPYRLIVIHAWPVRYASAVENFLHQRFASVKLCGEWFQLLPDEVESLKTIKSWDIDMPRSSDDDGLDCLAIPGTLRALLNSHSIESIKDFGDRSGLSKSQAWNLWHGHSQLGLNLAKKLSANLNIPLADLTTLDRTPPTPSRGRGGPRRYRSG